MEIFPYEIFEVIVVITYHQDKPWAEGLTVIQGEAFSH